MIIIVLVCPIAARVNKVSQVITDNEIGASRDEDDDDESLGLDSDC